jgi:hypothetical protein
MQMETLFLVSYISLWLLVVALFIGLLFLYRHFDRKLLVQQQRLEGGGPRLNERMRVTLRAVDGSDHSLASDEIGQSHEVLPVLRTENRRS